jgi:predicted pyridoxine 5'-phosphate oxidase superfamily flavin-nucleotide-binding protein
MIVRDRTLRDSMALNGRVPELATVIRVERAYFHCGKCIVRSKLWDSLPNSEQLPAPGASWLRMFAEKRTSP